MEFFQLSFLILHRTKWNTDKSNVRDYIHYLKTSQSRSGRTPDNIPKPKFMSVIAKFIGMECAELEPVSGKLI